MAEGLALREALACGIEKGLRQVRCESDSSKLITAINKGSPVAEIYGIVADIRCLALAFDSISFCWIQRSRNKDADALAKQALWNESIVIAPSNINTIKTEGSFLRCPFVSTVFTILCHWIIFKLCF